MTWSEKSGKGDFEEGVRALLIDKDQKPKWKHESIEKVPERDVAQFFDPVSRELIIDPSHPYEYDRWAAGSDPTKWRDVDVTMNRESLVSFSFVVFSPLIQTLCLFLLVQRRWSESKPSRNIPWLLIIYLSF